LRTSTTDERGFTIVEVIAAMLVMFLSIFGILSSFDSSIRGSHTSEREVAAAAVAQQQLEQLLARPYAELANCTVSGTSPSAAGTDVTDPRFLITSGSPPRLKIRQRPRSDTNTALVTGTPATGEPFVLNTNANCIGADTAHDGTGVIAGPLPVTAVATSRVFGAKIYRFVTWDDEPACVVDGATFVNTLVGSLLGLVTALVDVLKPVLSANLTAMCANTQDAKRVTVAVVLPRVGNGAGLKKPVYLSALVPDPNAGTGLNLPQVDVQT
jgi:type II secretory pathway pseudopilin PulG